MTHNTAYALSASQTPALPKAPKKPKGEAKQKVKTQSKTEVKLKSKETKPKPKMEARITRIDTYLDHLRRDAKDLIGPIRFIVADSFYAKVKFVSGVLGMGLHLISKLRHDADLRWLYTGEQKSKGRRRRYAEKVRFDDLSRFEFVAEQDGQRIYTAIVNSPSFKCNLRIVYLVRKEKGKTYTALLFSTDINWPALDILRYYKVRFQIEFLFRDAKQHTGLCDCQATCETALGFHFNASLSALNLLRMEDRDSTKTLRTKIRRNSLS